MPEHGTRTMYVHYGCRCEACCRAEHRQYLKREIAKRRTRVYSKWGDIPKRTKSDRQLQYDAKRRRLIKERPSEHTAPIRWHEIAAKFGMKCAICGCEVDPSDRWINENGRHCYGSKYPTVDHIVPIKFGGSDTFDNVQLACKRCNSSKGAKVVSA